MPTSNKRPREAAIIYAEKRLEPWGKWSKDHPEQLGYPRISIIHKITKRKLVRGASKNKAVLTAKGKETLSFRPRVIGECSDEVAETDWAVASLSANLKKILEIEYIEYSGSPLEEKC